MITKHQRAAVIGAVNLTTKRNIKLTPCFGMRTGMDEARAKRVGGLCGCPGDASADGSEMGACSWLDPVMFDRFKSHFMIGISNPTIQQMCTSIDEIFLRSYINLSSRQLETADRHLIEHPLELCTASYGSEK